MHAAPSVESSRVRSARPTVPFRAAFRSRLRKARRRAFPGLGPWLAVVLVAGLLALVGPESWERLACVALGVGLGGLLSCWRRQREPKSLAAVSGSFVYLATPPPWESSTSLH